MQLAAPLLTHSRCRQRFDGFHPLWVELGGQYASSENEPYCQGSEGIPYYLFPCCLSQEPFRLPTG